MQFRFLKLLPSSLKCCHANLILLQVSEMRARRGQKNEDSEGEIMMLCIHLSFALLYFYDNACCRKCKSRTLNFLRLKENTVQFQELRGVPVPQIVDRKFPFLCKNILLDVKLWVLNSGAWSLFCLFFWFRGLQNQQQFVFSAHYL